MHILICPNAFKHSLDAISAAEAIKLGFEQSRLECTCECFPIADGGDGTGELIIQRLQGERIAINVHDPLGRIIRASYGIIDGGETAVIEMANASGLRLLAAPELSPLLAYSFGTGELIKDALNQGVKKIIIALGGSATVDGGTGILQALGARFLDSQNTNLLTLPRDLISLYSIDDSQMDSRIFETEVIVLCDVENTLLGPQGAAAVFGPQKGASAEEVRRLEKSLETFCNVAFEKTGRNMADIRHGGAAGGAAAGLQTFLNAKLVNGINYFLTLTNFDASLQRSDLVLTGEGSIDVQTLQGKGPWGVAKKAKENNLPVIAFAGKVPLEENIELRDYFDVLLAIGNEASHLDEALKSTKDNLIRTAREMGNLLALKKDNNLLSR